MNNRNTPEHGIVYRAIDGLGRALAKIAGVSEPVTTTNDEMSYREQLRAYSEIMKNQDERDTN